jgi:hypothetical protein
VSLPAHRLTTPLTAFALALLACLLAASTYHVFGHTWDEPEHIAAGLVLLDRGDYVYDDQHPPLARLAAALGPYLAGSRLLDHISPFGEAAGRDVLYHSPASYDTVLTLARLGMLPFLVVLVLSSWLWARRWFGGATATLAALFVVTTPVLLGHAAVAAIDVPVTGLIILSLYLLQRWMEEPSPGRAAGFGLASGLAISAKLSAVPFIGVCVLVLAAARVLCLGVAPRAWLWRQRIVGCSLAATLVVLVIVGVYGPKLIYLTTPDFAPAKALDALVGGQGALHDAAYRFFARVRVPIGVREVVQNFIGVAWHNAHGHPSFLLGETGQNGWWYFYPVALAVKTPLPLLVAGLGGLGLLSWRGARERSVPLLAPPLCFIAILGFSSAYSHINIGVRHVMVLYPLLALGAAYAVTAAWSATVAMTQPGARVALHTGLAALLLWQAGTLLVWPDYLAYFNVLAGAHPERILVDSDLDWGQDLRRLSHELARRRADALYLAYSGSADLTLEHLPPFQPLPPDQPVTGWIAIDMLTLKDNRPHYDWLLGYTPITRVGKSIDLYRIDHR